MITYKDNYKYISLPAKEIKLVLLDSLGHEEEHVISKQKSKNTYQGFFGAFGWTVKEVNVNLKHFDIVNDYF